VNIFSCGLCCIKLDRRGQCLRVFYIYKWILGNKIIRNTLKYLLLYIPWRYICFNEQLRTTGSTLPDSFALLEFPAFCMARNFWVLSTPCAVATIPIFLTNKPSLDHDNELQTHARRTNTHTPRWPYSISWHYVRLVNGGALG